jgi:hypothetical protein
MVENSPESYLFKWKEKKERRHTMKRYQGNQTVEPGLYFNLAQCSFKSVETKGPLPGSEKDVYRRTPVVALLAVGPILGLAFVAFLPFVGFAMLGWLLVSKLAAWSSDAAVSFARVVRPAFRPALAFLSRSKRTKSARKERDRWADGVKRDLEQAKPEDK